MNVEVNENIHVRLSIVPRKNKLDFKMYNLYLLFDIRDAGLKHSIVEFSTGNTVVIKDWDISRKIMKGRTEKAGILNEEINRIFITAKRHLLAFGRTDNITAPDVVQLIKTLIKFSITGKGFRGSSLHSNHLSYEFSIEQVHTSLFNYRNQSEGRKRIYRHAVGILYQFFNYETPPITDISESDLLAFQDWYKKNYRIKSGKKKGKAPTQNSTTTWFSMIASIFLHASKRMKILSASPLPEKFRGAFKDAKRNVLSPAECMRIIRLDNEELSRTELVGKYSFMFQCLTGIGYGDLLHLRFEKGETYSHRHRKKRRNIKGNTMERE